MVAGLCMTLSSGGQLSNPVWTARFEWMKAAVPTLVVALTKDGCDVNRDRVTLCVVSGWITKHERRRIEVQCADGTTTLIKIGQQTVIARGDKAAGAADLAVGQRVVVDAFGDNAKDLLAIEIRIAPPSPRREGRYR